jgi:sjoegren syndrome nuclear autoantigen 1
MRNEYDQVIQETEAAYSRLLESSRSLLTVLERETLNIHRDKKTSEQAEAMVLV